MAAGTNWPRISQADLIDLYSFSYASTFRGQNFFSLGYLAAELPIWNKKTRELVGLSREYIKSHSEFLCLHMYVLETEADPNLEMATRETDRQKAVSNYSGELRFANRRPQRSATRIVVD
jgi:hypothetical protein